MARVFAKFLEKELKREKVPSKPRKDNEKEYLLDQCGESLCVRKEQTMNPVDRNIIHEIGNSIPSDSVCYFGRFTPASRIYSRV